MRLVASQQRRIQSLKEELKKLRTNVVERVQNSWVIEQRYTRLLNERNRLRPRLVNDEEDLRKLKAEERRREGNNNRDRLWGVGF